MSMHDNQGFRLIVFICIGYLLSTTACTQYSRGSAMDTFSYDPTREGEGVNGHLDYKKIINGAIAQCDLSTIDWSEVDWSEFDLCKVNDQKTLLCIAIERGALNLLQSFLAHIKSNPVQYPCTKVLYLIAGCGIQPRVMNMKMPLLMRAVAKGHSDHPDIALDMVKLLFQTLHHYDPDYDRHACEQAFLRRFGFRKYTIMHQAVACANFAIVEYLIKTFIDTKKAQGLACLLILNSLVQILNIKNNINATPVDLAEQVLRNFNSPDSLKIRQRLLEYVGRFPQTGSELHTVGKRVDGEMLKNITNISQADLSTIDWSKVDLSKIDLCKAKDQKTLLCKAIELGDLDLLEKFLGHIESNPAQYPSAKVLYLITGVKLNLIADVIKLKGINMKMPLLMRAVIKAHSDHPDIALDMVERLFQTLRYCKLDPEGIFSLRFGSEQYTIMHEVVETSNFEIVKCLINTFIDTKKARGLTGFSLSNSLVEILNMENSARATPLDLAFQAYSFFNTPSSLKILRLLLEYVDPLFQIESQSIFSLHTVAERGDGEMLKNMLNAIIEKLKKINKPQYKEMIQRIVNLPDEHGRTLLYYTVICEAAKRSKSDIVEYLMALGASCTCFDKNGISPLFIAIAFGALDIVELLLDKKFPGNASLQSDINNQGRAGLTPLNFSVSCRENVIISVISKLFDTYIKYYNRGMNYKNVNNAALIGKIDCSVIQSLLHAGASLSIPDESGQLPMHKAVKNGGPDLVELLLQAGANPLIENLQGSTAFDISIEQIHAKFSEGYDNTGMIKVLALLVSDPSLDANRYGDADDFTIVYRCKEIENILKSGDHKGQRAPLKDLLASWVKGYGISTKMTSQCKGKKRPLVDPTIKRNPKRLRECDTSSGKPQAA